MPLRASRSAGWLVFAAWSSLAGCKSEARRDPASELGRTLTRAVPGSARSVSAPEYDAGKLSVSGSREFVTEMTWSEYAAFLDGALSPDWRPDDGADAGGSTRRFSKMTTGDAYFLSAENVSPTGPLHVHITVLGVPD